MIPRSQRVAEMPWVGALLDPQPGRVFDESIPVRLTDAAGMVVSVDDRGEVSSAPAVCAVGDARPQSVSQWTGPWPVVERWWDPERAHRLNRFQVVLADGGAWLIFRDEEGRHTEVRYD